MDWSNISFAPVGANIYQSLSPVLSGAAGELAGSKGRLSSITGVVPVARNPLSTGAATVAALRSALIDLTAQSGQCVCVHPYVHTVGHRRGEYSYLTPNDALKALGNKLIDAEEKLPSGKLGAVFVLLYGATHADFVKQLGAFLQVFPVTELQLVMRRANALNTHEKDKFITPAGRMWPEFRQRDLRQHGTVRSVGSCLGPLVAVGEGYNEATTPEAQLAALMDKKAAHIQQAENAWQQLVATMQGGAGKAMYCEGSLAGLRAELFKSGTPSSVYKLCTAMCWLGAPQQLTVLKEVFGL
ncbi:hypothetical protein [Halodesulfovibrio aestuarii]|uniref:hypothetical protein n=1 Tax=Halodesulfovibrio aestuarii TaxID=126333 RepID=UPI000410D86A